MEKGAERQVTDQAAIRIADVSKVYKLYQRNRDRIADAFGLPGKRDVREHYALRHISLEIRRGETVGIIGTNGAGKSTLLKIITGVLAQTEGKVEINGRISALLELGAGFNMEYTGIENIYLNGTMMGYSKKEIDERLDGILRFADIGDFVHQPVKMYSSGMFVRLAFALAINIDPEILVVDEALSVGDVFFQAKCFQKFEDFKKEGKTILFVSHDLSSISKYCDRVVLLNKGDLLADGTPKDMIDLYKKILTGSERDREQAENSGTAGSTGADDVLRSDARGTDWKTHMTVNPLVSSYGDKKAEIVDFAVEDEAGRLTDTLIKGAPFSIRYRVYFRETVEHPIFTFTFKTVQGTDVTGTNTMIENVLPDKGAAGELYEVCFTQDMDLQGGEYLLSISCTGFEQGELKAHHRLYDLLSVTVVSDKDTVGVYDMRSKTTVRKIGEDT